MGQQIPARQVVLSTKDSKRLEDRIYTLVEKAIAAQNPEELESVITELRAALKEHTERIRKLAASKLTAKERRKID